jgi:hypothetical protein
MLIAACNPATGKQDGRYSRPLYNWMVRHRARYHGDSMSAWRNEDGQVYIGVLSKEKTCVRGSRLSSIVWRQNGGQQVVCFVWVFKSRKKDLEFKPWVEDKDFWHGYMEHGLCAYDRPHRHNYFPVKRCFNVGRFRQTTKTRRVCMWCGQEQRLVKRVVRTVHQDWHNRSPVTAPAV